jgi:50S ribosomal subunit-associated GTPase HflX
VLVFDVSSAESYGSLARWREVFLQTTGAAESAPPLIIVGNKIDRQAAVTSQQVNRDWVTTQKAKLYLEASALRVEGISRIFEAVAYYAKEYQQSQSKDTPVGMFSPQIINIQANKHLSIGFRDGTGNESIKTALHKQKQKKKKKQGQCNC